MSRLALAAALVLAGACGDDVTRPAADVAGPDAAGADTPDWPAVDHAPDALGPFEVGHLSFTAVDASRGDRELLIDVWYPVDPGTAGQAPVTSYPLAAAIGLDSPVAREEAPATTAGDRTLLVFSHGYTGINTQSTALMEALASHGFVVAAPEHAGNSQADPSDSFDEAAEKRVPDVAFVLDTLLARDADPADLLHGTLRRERMGVVGHSFGGMTALGAAAGWAGAPADGRVAAIAPLSAVIDRELQEDERVGPNAGFAAEQLAAITVPVLLVGGTADTDVPVGNNALAYDQLTQAPAVVRVDIVGANHTHFANICAIGDRLIELGLDEETWAAIGAEDLIAPYEATCTPEAFPIAAATRLINRYVVAFFRRHLRDEAGYGRYLHPSDAEGEPAVELWAR